jgi:hypothetical protein
MALMFPKRLVMYLNRLQRINVHLHKQTHATPRKEKLRSLAAATANNSEKPPGLILHVYETSLLTLPTHRNHLIFPHQQE